MSSASVGFQSVFLRFSEADGRFTVESYDRSSDVTGIVAGLDGVELLGHRRNVLYPPFIFSLIWLAIFFYLQLAILPMVKVRQLGASTLPSLFRRWLPSAPGAVLRNGAGVGVQPWSLSQPARRPGVVSTLLLSAVVRCFFLEIERLSAVGGLDSLINQVARAAIINALASWGEAGL